MPVETLTEDDRWAPDLAAISERAVVAALVHLGLEPEAVEVAVLGCDDARIATLNADFRGKPSATNVLSWPAFDLSAEEDGGPPEVLVPGPEEIPLFLGDIAIAYETCAAEARAADKAFEDHVTHLLVHATLHLLGYDHIRDTDATLMEREEVKILGKMGLSDPYID